MELDLVHWLALAAALFLAGFLDAIAGGGGLVSVPAFLAAGLPPHLALGTNKLVAVTGSLTSTWRYARAGLVRRESVALAVLACATSAAGAFTAVSVPEHLLKPVLIALLMGALGTVLWRPRRGRAGAPAPTGTPWTAGVWVAAAAIGFYDGFFGPGTGSLLIALFVTLGRLSLDQASGNAKLLNFGSNLGAVALFASRGQVLAPLGLTLIPVMVAGSWAGASLGVKRGAPLIRALLTAVVLALCVKLGWDLWRGR